MDSNSFLGSMRDPQAPRATIRNLGEGRSALNLLQLLLGEDYGRIQIIGLDGDNDQSLQQIIQQLMEDDPNRYGPPPASKKSVDLLKKRALADYRDSNVECCVCLTKIAESLKEQELEGKEAKLGETDIIEMPCEHTFHQECLLPWLEQHNSCPTCRHELPTEDPEYERMKQQRAS
mmetsp:Transcript_16972/g.28718  ORF Transcript_16972/g.28718 Transcript_16972/m.28718 type:complete len:176 (-) Transcript_16972:210-737(-)